MLPGSECLFPQVREIFSHFFKNRFSDPLFFLFSFWHPCNMNVLQWRMFHIFHNLFSFFILFDVWLGYFLLPCLLDCWSILLHSIICCWFLLVYFSFMFFNSEFFSYFLFVNFIRNSAISISFYSFPEVLFCLEHIPLSPLFLNF